MRIHARVVTAILGAGLLLAACGGPDTGVEARSVSVKTIQLAASNTQAAESTRFEIDMQSEFMDMHASGVTSGDGKTGQSVIEMAGGRMEQRVVDGVIYMDFGDGGDGLFEPTDGKRWVKLDLSGFADALDPGAAGTLGPQTPGSTLDMLRDLVGNVEQVGEDTIAGRHAVHYRANLDTGGESSPVDVWIDDQDRVVKMHLTMPGGMGELTMQIVEFGVPVDVVAPPPEEVADMGDLFSDLSELLPDDLRDDLPSEVPPWCKCPEAETSDSITA
jgi:hypothetical protein